MKILTQLIVPVSIGALLAAAPLTSQQFLVSQLTGNDTFGAKSTGQTFTPSIGINPKPGAVASLPLVEVTLYHGNFTSASPSPATYLNIYNGDPNNGGSFIGSSSNTIDTTGLSFHAPLVWTFKDLMLKYTTEHWAVMSTTNSAGSLGVAVSLETGPRSTNPYIGGAGLIANHVKHPNDVDAMFEFKFNGAPAQGTFTVSGTGCASSVGIATIGSATAPKLGNPLTVDVTKLAPTGLPFLALGLSDTTWTALNLPLPVSLSALLPGSGASCQILISLDFTLAMSPAGLGAASTTIQVPNNQNLLGLVLYFQGLQIENGTSITLTAKGTAVLGQ